MMIFRRLLALTLLACMLCPAAQAATATPTPAPILLEEEVLQPPALIQSMLDIAYGEWQALDGKTLKKCNKYTEWRGKGVSFGWCGGFITWCMLDAGVPMEELEYFKKSAGGDGFYPAPPACRSGATCWCTADPTTRPSTSPWCMTWRSWAEAATASPPWKATCPTG